MAKNKELNIPGISEDDEDKPVVEKEKKEKTALDVLFPIKEVELSDGSIVSVKPLSLKDLPKVSDAFGRLMSMAETGCSPAEIATRAFGELTSIIPYCIDLPVESIPAISAPDILEAVIEQNVSEDVVKKWMALVEKLDDVVPDLKGQGVSLRGKR